MQLRLTRQALIDLDLDVASHSRLSATAYVGDHKVVKAFVDRRSQKAQGRETTELPITEATVFNLHVARYRALTWHDEDRDVVWLLGVGWHESGSIDDAYIVLKQRDVAGKLMPSIDDYIDLELTLAQTQSFVARVDEEVPDLLARARARPGFEVTQVIADRIALGVVVNVVVIQTDFSAEEIYVGFELPPKDGGCDLPPQSEWIRTILARMLPDGTDISKAEYGKPFPRTEGSRDYEITVYWSSL